MLENWIGATFCAQGVGLDKRLNEGASWRQIEHKSFKQDRFLILCQSSQSLVAGA